MPIFYRGLDTGLTLARGSLAALGRILRSHPERSEGSKKILRSLCSLRMTGTVLIGEYQHTIDEKKRLAIPAKLRKELGKGAVLTRGFDNCLALYPLKEWEKLADKLSKLPTGQAEVRAMARVMMSGAVEVEFDSLGRILVPDYLKQYAAIEKNVVIAGVFKNIEIWDQRQWDGYKQKTEKTVGDMAAKLSEIGF